MDEQRYKERKTGKLNTYHKPDSGHAWIILAACAIIFFLILGSFRCYGIIFISMVGTFNVTREEASWPLVTAGTLMNTSGLKFNAQNNLSLPMKKRAAFSNSRFQGMTIDKIKSSSFPTYNRLDFRALELILFTEAHNNFGLPDILLCRFVMLFCQVHIIHHTGLWSFPW